MRLIKAAQIFKAFGDRTRLRMLFLLKNRALTGTQLADVLRVPRARVTRHLAYLHKSQLVSVRHEHNEAYYAIRQEHEPLQKVLSGEVVSVLRTVDGMTDDLARLKVRYGMRAGAR